MKRTTNQAAIWTPCLCQYARGKIGLYSILMQYTDAVQIEMFIFQPMSSEKKKLNGGYSLIGLPVIHLKQYTYPVDAVGTVDPKYRSFALMVNEIPEYWKCQN